MFCLSVLLLWCPKAITGGRRMQRLLRDQASAATGALDSAKLVALVKLERPVLLKVPSIPPGLEIRRACVFDVECLLRIADTLRILDSLRGRQRCLCCLLSSNHRSGNGILCALVCGFIGTDTTRDGKDCESGE